jgi:hypothetical protein
MRIEALGVKTPKNRIVVFIAATDRFNGHLIHVECADPDEDRGRRAGDIGSRCPRCGYLLMIPPDQSGRDLGLHPIVGSPAGQEYAAKIAASSAAEPADRPPAWARGRNLW